MDATTERRLDALVEDEVRVGYIVRDVPSELDALLRGEGMEPLGRVRFTRLNAARRRKIAEVVQRQYHRDMQNPDILSNEQLRKLAAERGEWTKEKEARVEELTEKTQREMRELYSEGLHADNWMEDILEHARLFREAIHAEDAWPEEEREAVLERFDRWVEYSPDQREHYTERYAAEQDRPQYSPDLDLDVLLDKAPSGVAGEALVQIDELRDRLYRIIRLRRDQHELVTLRESQIRIFSDSCESRRDAAENLARVYFCTERVDAAGIPIGPITPTFEAVWDLPDDVSTWLLEEQYFFINGVPQEARDMLTAFGFRTAARGQTEETSSDGVPAPSVESPAPLSSKDDSTPAMETAAVSLAPLRVTT